MVVGTVKGRGAKGSRPDHYPSFERLSWYSRGIRLYRRYSTRRSGVSREWYERERSFETINLHLLQIPLFPLDTYVILLPSIRLPPSSSPSPPPLLRWTCLLNILSVSARDLSKFLSLRSGWIGSMRKMRVIFRGNLIMLFDDADGGIQGIWKVLSKVSLIWVICKILFWCCIFFYFCLLKWKMFRNFRSVLRRRENF